MKLWMMQKLQVDKKEIADIDFPIIGNHILMSVEIQNDPGASS